MIQHIKRRGSTASLLFIVTLLPLIFNPLAVSPFEPAKQSFFRIGVTLMTVLYLLNRVPQKTAVNRGDPLAVAVFLFLLSYAAATFFSISWQTSLWGEARRSLDLITILCGAVFFFISSELMSDKNVMNYVVDGLLISSVPISIYGIAQSLGFDPLAWQTDSVSPVASTIGRSNFLGAYLAMIVPFTLQRLLSASPNNDRWRLTVVIAIQITCLTLTLARAAWLGLLGSTVIFFGLLAYQWKDRKMFWIGVVSLLVSLCGFAFINSDTLPKWYTANTLNIAGEKNDTALVGQQREASMFSRLAIWQTTVQLIPARLAFGYGPETFATVFAANYPSELAHLEGANKIIDDPHNLFLNHLFSTGIIGVITLLCLLFIFYRNAMKVLQHCSDKHTQALLVAVIGSLTAFLIQAQFNPNTITLSMLFWLCLSFIAALSRSAALQDARCI